MQNPLSYPIKMCKICPRLQNDETHCHNVVKIIFLQNQIVKKALTMISNESDNTLYDKTDRLITIADVVFRRLKFFKEKHPNKRNKQNPNKINKQNFKRYIKLKKNVKCRHIYFS